MTGVHAYGGGYMIRGARGRFTGVAKAPAPGKCMRLIDGVMREVTITRLPDAPIPGWCKARPIGKSQHGKRRGVRHGERDHAAYRAYALSR